MIRKLLLCLVVGISLHGQGYSEAIKQIGTPVVSKDLDFKFTCPGPGGSTIAWASFIEPGLRTAALVGIRTDNGEMIWKDLSSFGGGKMTFINGKDHNIYIYTGIPAHFLRFEPATQKLTDLGVPAAGANYFADGALAPDGVFYVGTFPGAVLVACDTSTGTLRNFGRIPDDTRETYLFPDLAVSDDNIVYCPAGLHHQELWSIDPTSGKKRQILPASFLANQGAPVIFKGLDGKVYGHCSGQQFRCLPDRIEIINAIPEKKPPLFRAGERTFGGLNARGELELRGNDGQVTSRVPTHFPGRKAAIFSVTCEHDGKIYGSTSLPGDTFRYDPATGKFEDLGVITTGTDQVYDAISLRQGILMCSYFGAQVDLFDPSKPVVPGKNPKHLGAATGQERPVQWCKGPDGMLYTGTEPAKGRLGGSLMRVDPDKGTIRVFPTPLKDLSIEFCEAIPQTGELLCTTSIQGGTSAVPTQTRAYIFLWDTKSEKMTFIARPVPGATTYGRVVLAKNGKIYGIAGSQFYVFDPIRRKTDYVADLPGKNVIFPGLVGRPVGRNNLIVGMADDCVYAIDPRDNHIQVFIRNPAILSAHGFMVANDGTLYFGSGSDLYSCKLTILTK
jgi:outer membrane protein assembly factor BamB